MRPKRPHPDSNNSIVRDFVMMCCGGGGMTIYPGEKPGTMERGPSYEGWYMGVHIWATPLDKVGGDVVDWLIWAGTQAGNIEVKPTSQFRKNGELIAGRLRPGERYTLDNHPGPVKICTTVEDVRDFVEVLIGMKGKLPAAQKPYSQEDQENDEWHDIHDDANESRRIGELE